MQLLNSKPKMTEMFNKKENYHTSYYYKHIIPRWYGFFFILAIIISFGPEIPVHAAHNNLNQCSEKSHDWLRLLGYVPMTATMVYVIRCNFKSFRAWRKYENVQKTNVFALFLLAFVVCFFTSIFRRLWNLINIFFAAIGWKNCYEPPQVVAIIHYITKSLFGACNCVIYCWYLCKKDDDNSSNSQDNNPDEIEMKQQDSFKNNVGEELVEENNAGEERVDENNVVEERVEENSASRNSNETDVNEETDDQTYIVVPNRAPYIESYDSTVNPTLAESTCVTGTDTICAVHGGSKRTWSVN